MQTKEVAALRVALRAEKARRSFYEFVKMFWPVVEPGAPYVDNWHIAAICEHLQAVTEGHIRRLVINVPFRTAKSTLTSVLWPAWVWITRPSHQWLCGSYAEKLAIRDALRMRRLITSPLYTSMYGESFAMTKDQNAKLRFQNDQNGYRIAFGMTGGVMGDGGNTLLIDDPHDRQSAHSDAERERDITTYDQALITRLNNQATDSIVIIMQRLHHLDLSGHVLIKHAHEGWVHLMIPMEFEPARRCVTKLGWRDPRTQEGELMFPERFPAATVAGLAQVLGEYGRAGQLQQRPSPEGGGRLKVKHFQLWPNGAPLPDLHLVVQSYDTAFTDKTQNDPTANTTWGSFFKTIQLPDGATEQKRCALLLDSWTEHLAYPKLRQKIIDDWKAEYGGAEPGTPGEQLHPPRRPDLLLIEEKGSGQSVMQDLRLANIPCVPYNPKRADKTARVAMTAPLLELDTFYVLESRRPEDKGKPIKWARPLLEQCEQFPNAEHDDLVDTFTQAAIYLRDAGLIELPYSAADPVEDIDYVEKKRARTNPYLN